MKKFLFCLLIFTNLIQSNNIFFKEQNSTILIYKNKEQNFSQEYYDFLNETFTRFNINFAETDDLTNIDENNLYIIFNPTNIEKFPKFYIVYSTIDLEESQLNNNDYINKLSNAVAVWDHSWNNILKYSKTVQNYYYLPIDYEFVDPVILPCFIPLENLGIYKEVLINSNSKNTDASSHLPIIFAYSLVNNPKTIIEAGVASGGTSNVFYKVATLCKSKLIGIDNQEQFRPTYSNLNNATFYCINDLDFLNHYQMDQNKKIDIIFIDTSHEFQHTLNEIKLFLPLLDKNGLMIFHDSNVTPLRGNSTYKRINKTYGTAFGNTRGVTYALKNFFSISFDEHKYCNFEFNYNNSSWQMVHYPFCNGLTIFKKKIQASIDENKLTFPNFIKSHFSQEVTNRILILKELYEKNDLSRIERSKEPLIPLKIHQIWIGPKPLPKEFDSMIQTWKDNHPNWKYKLWTNEDLKSFNLENQAIFDMANNWGTKADIFRYEILYRYGGVYIDIDFECLKPLDELNFHYNFYTGIVNDCDCIANGLIGSREKHPILYKCIQGIKKIKDFDNEEYNVMYKTGPNFFGEIVYDFISKQSNQNRIIIFPSYFFYPFPNQIRFQLKNKWKKNEILSFIKPETFAIHYWANSWQDSNAQKLV